MQFDSDNRPYMIAGARQCLKCRLCESDRQYLDASRQYLTGVPGDD